MICLALLAASTFGTLYHLTATDKQGDFHQCARIVSDPARLACYDALTLPLHPATDARGHPAHPSDGTRP